MTQPRYAHYYLILSVFSTLLFGSTVLDFGPLCWLSPAQSTGVVIVSFTVLTVLHSLSGS